MLVVEHRQPGAMMRKAWAQAAGRTAAALLHTHSAPPVKPYNQAAFAYCANQCKCVCGAELLRGTLQGTFLCLRAKGCCSTHGRCSACGGSCYYHSRALKSTPCCFCRTYDYENFAWAMQLPKVSTTRGGVRYGRALHEGGR